MKDLMIGIMAIVMSKVRIVFSAVDMKLTNLFFLPLSITSNRTIKTNTTRIRKQWEQMMKRIQKEEEALRAIRK
jgi:hypothetical protein